MKQEVSRVNIRLQMVTTWFELPSCPSIHSLSSFAHSKTQEWLMPDSLSDFPAAMLSQVIQVVVEVVGSLESYQTGRDFSQPRDMMVVESGGKKVHTGRRMAMR